MRTQRDYYEILGLPRTANIPQIKRRYRELARKYHPDVTRDKAVGQKAFVQITEAYKTLVDPEKRRAYDATLIDATQPMRTSPGAARSSSPTRPRPPLRAEVARLVKDAEMAFIRRRLNQAAELCKQAIRLDMTCARAHAVLGDVYRARRLHDHAINEYNYAVQFDPADEQSRKKLEKLPDRAVPITFSWETPEGRLSNQAILGSIIGWGFAFFLLFLIYIYPGEPIPLLKTLIGPIGNWSWNLIAFMFADGVLVGFLLGVNGLAGHPDDELIFESGGRGWAIVPTGLLLLIFPPLFFLGAAALYLLFAFAQDTISKSIVRVIGAVMAIVLISAAMYPLDRLSVVLFGGNVVFVGALVGWYLGAILRAE